MNQIILRALNPFFFVILITFGIALQTSLFRSYPLEYLQTNIVLLATVWLAMRREFTEGGIIILILCNIAEIHSGAPSGLFLVTYMLVYLVLRAMKRYFLLSRLTSLIHITLFSTGVLILSQLILIRLLNLPHPSWFSLVIRFLFSLSVNGLTGITVYRWFEKFDRMTFKDPRAREDAESRGMDLLDDDLQARSEEI